MENDAIATQYRTNQIQTASPDRLVLMLYEGALKAAKDCRDAIESHDWTTMTRTGRQVQDIMIGLVDTLNGSEGTATLRDLYLYCWKNTVSAQTQRDSRLIEGVVTVLQNLADGLQKFLSTAQVARPLNSSVNAEMTVSGSVNLAG